MRKEMVQRLENICRDAETSIDGLDSHASNAKKRFEITFAICPSRY